MKFTELIMNLISFLVFEQAVSIINPVYIRKLQRPLKRYKILTSNIHSLDYATTQAVSCCFLPQQPDFNPTSVNMGSMVEIVALGQVFSE